MAVDIREVARRSGVSPATASRALNAHPNVADATRARVLATARELGYQPNQQARALVRQRSDTVGLIWDTGYVRTHGRQSFLQDLLVALKMALAETGYHLMLLSPSSTAASPSDFVSIAAQHSLEGVALMAVNAHLPAVDALIASRRPCVGLDLPVRGARASYVSADNQQGTALAVEHLAGLGHRRIATITGGAGMMPGVERREGFSAAMAAAGLDVPPEYVAEGDFFLESGLAAMRRLLALPSPPTAVFAAGDLMAIGAVRAAEEAGLSVPRDVSVVGFDDIEPASLVHPGLTTVGQDYLAMGRAAVELLVQIIADPRVTGPRGGARRGPAPRLLPGRLVVRGTTAPPA
ncbi:LacI family transcriptional regulator [Kineococcus xinjiangensis]|uniref:LacI family transcriptional regulator n=1 Tax=Kineococcus xinjiangensis TaxID=512762 RepID=A0A2S6IT08_9ACTN|nr:LacI family DNA-binding transcriptional regulator [Kineococcus xinjiangensis]PPK97310.1 LacI family transcriptional regulator [Kineococcus xinjiangensis]